MGCDWKSELLLLTSGAEKVLIIYSESQPQPIIDLGDTEIFFHPIPDGEIGKSLSVLERIWSTLGASGFTKSDILIAVGGGAVTDVAGFAAATWFRGIPWIAVPSTLAGMVDAAVGGKTAINSPYGKNLIGAFHSPIAVLIDLAWVKTLSQRDISAGFAEVIKCGFIVDRAILDIFSMFSFEELVSNDDHLLNLISKAVSVKAAVVGEDFKESYAREALNYGHTFGHAIEKFLRYELRHGECVAIGMIFVAELAHARGLIDSQTLALHRELLEKVQLPTSLPAGISRTDFDQIKAIMRQDKKNKSGSLRFVVLSDQGLQRLSDVSDSELFTAYERVLS